MTACTLTHDEDGIPAFLCRWCHPELNRRRDDGAPEVTIPAITTPSERDPAAAEKLERRQRRRLRAEVKLWQHRIKLMKNNNIDKRDIKKAEEALRQATHALYLVS